MRTKFCYGSPIEKPIPSYEEELVPLTDGPNCHVFLEKDSQTVLKFFLAKSCEKPNLDILKSISAYQEVRLDKIAPTLHVLKYKYCDDSHQPRKLSQFRGVVQMLAKLHEMDYVHGDVRSQNIVFTTNTSVLIDYDLYRDNSTALIVEY